MIIRTIFVATIFAMALTALKTLGLTWFASLVFAGLITWFLTL